MPRQDPSLGSAAQAKGYGMTGVVLGVAEASATARRFCSATGRSLGQVSRAADLGAALAEARGQSSAFVIIPGHLLTFATANALIEAEARTGVPVGVLPVDDHGPGQPDPLLPTAGFGAAGYRHRTALYCDFLARPPEAATTAEPVFGRATAAQFIDWLAEGVEGAVLHAHGNGADFRVGSHVLCTQVGAGKPSPSRPGERFLPCQAGGRCRLEHKTSFAAYHGPGAVRSRLLVLLSCSAFYLADGLLDPRFSLASALFRGGYTQGIIASTRINFGTPELSLAVLASLDAGRPLGEITSGINGVTRYGPPSYLCLGDPELRLAGPSSVSLPAGPDPRRARPDPATGGTGAARAAFLAGWLFTADMLRRTEPASATTPAADRLRRTALVGEQADLDRDLDSELARSILDRLARPARTLPSLWQPLCEAEQTMSGPACPKCLVPTQISQFRSRLYRGYRRRIRSCAVHGLLSDTPVTSQPGTRGACVAAWGGALRVRQGQFAWLADLTVPAPTARWKPNVAEAAPDPATCRAAARRLQSLMVQRAIDSGDVPSGSSLASQLDDQVGLELTGDPSAAAQRHAVDRAFCGFLARVLARRGPDVHDYLHGLISEGPQHLVPRQHNCGGQLVRACLTPAWPTAGDRWLYACERCGTVANQPVTLELAEWSAARPGRAEVDLPFASPDGWYASSVQPIAGRPDRPSRMRTREASHRWPHLSLPVPRPDGPGLRRWGIAAVSDGDYVVLQSPLAATRRST
jgi:hypothetical protein